MITAATGPTRRALIIGSIASMLGIISSFLPWTKISFGSASEYVSGANAGHYQFSIMAVILFVVGLFLLLAKVGIASMSRWAAWSAFSCGTALLAMCMIVMIQIARDNSSTYGLLQISPTIWLMMTMVGSIGLIIGCLLLEKASQKPSK